MRDFPPAGAALQAAVRLTTDRVVAARNAALAALPDAPAARAAARAARQAAVSRLPESLDRFEAAARRHGVTIHRAATADDAVDAVRGVLRAHGARRIVKSKSMATEEIRLRAALEADGCEVVETDLGEWLVQLAGQAPSHIIAPAIHLSRSEVRALLSAVAGRELTSDTESMAAFARAHLREKFLAADAGISGGNLLIAETGTVMIVSNEGNARMGVTLPRVHIAVVGVEKVVGTWSEALDVLRVLARSATGQRITQYVSFISGPRGGDGADGPDEVHVVLLDNGRSRLVGTPAEELLYCIRCGACLNVCPVYRTIGGHAYQSVYPGPIGAALTPRLTQGREGADLPWASSLCGACREACPVGIQLDDQLIALRGELGKPRAEAAAIRAFAAVAARPAAFRGALTVARWVLGGRTLERLPGPLAGWTRARDLAPLSRRRLRRGLSAERRRGGPDRTAGDGRNDEPDATPPAAAPEEALRRATPPAPAADPVEDFCAAWTAAGGTAVVVPPGGLRDAVADAVGPGAVAADPDLADLVPTASAVSAPRDAAVGLVCAWAAAAETGTVVLPDGPETDRRRSLLPPRVVCVVPSDRLWPDLRAAFDRLSLLSGADPPAGVTLLSGPSRSADIEHDLVIGVHGPGQAHAVIVRDRAPA